jgi:hypothetical protein
MSDAPMIGEGMDVSKKLTADHGRPAMRAAERLIDSIEPRSLASLRDRAIIGLIRYAAARLDAIIEMRVCDYYHLGNRGWIRILQNGVEHDILLPPHNPAETYLDEYLAAAGIQNDSTSPLFRYPLLAHGTKLSAKPMKWKDALQILRNRVGHFSRGKEAIHGPSLYLLISCTSRICRT